MFTDLEVSTRLWDQEPEAMRAALARHDAILREGVAAHGGFVVKGRGDGVHAVFVTADAAVRAAIDCELAMNAEQWTVSEPLRVRIGLHTGVAELREGDYFGSAVNRAARLMDLAHGGQVVCSHATADLAGDVLAEGMAFLDLGDHRLRDLSRAERVFQVHVPTLQRDFAPLRSLEMLPGNLPLQVSSFVGREREVDRAIDALRDARVVTLTGVGGVGKTRLALQVAAEVLPDFPDGAWLCELAAVRDPEQVVDAVAAVFRVTEHPGLSLVESLVSYLRDQQLLVVLDNCEHVLRAAARLVAAIEAQGAHVRVLATSREGLNIAGEQLLVVPSLGLPGDAGVDSADECEAVRLFVERARAVKADFAIDAVNRADVVAICTRLDGVALAIELAAARIPAMNANELARRLDRRFRLLSGGARIAIERHQTLRATIDWSFDLLSESEQRLLARLAVFTGGCTLEAAEVVCAGDPIDAEDVFESLAHLVAHHLVVADDMKEATRYRLLDTIRQYGEERLAVLEETDALRARHADYYAELAGVVRDHSYGPEQVAWTARLGREHDNLLAAMVFAIDTQDVERAMRLLCQLPYAGLQVNDPVAFDPEEVLALPGADEHPGSSVALVLAGVDATLRGDGARALELCDHAIAVEARLGPVPDWPLEMAVANLRAFVAGDAGLLEEAAAHGLEAARLAQEREIPAIAAMMLGLAAGYLAWHDPAAARQCAQDGLALAQRTGAPQVISFNLLTLAQSRADDDPREARVLLDEAIELWASLGYENPGELGTAVFTAARLAVWPTALQAASRALHHQLRSGALTVMNRAGILNLVARGLADRSPEPAAVIQGAVARLVKSGSTDAGVASSAGTVPSGGLVAFTTATRREATEILSARLGREQLRELRAQGEAMDTDQARRYARTHIHDYLAKAEEPT